MKVLMIVLVVLFTSCGNTYYIVRHAEKATQSANMSSDVPLTPEGEQRAQDLREALKGKKIGYVYSTNTIRTKSTAEPTASYFNLPIQTYGPRPDTAFMAFVKAKKKNTLIVGHSNTIDDLVNMLCGKKVIEGDLPETDYDNLFTVKKKGNKFVFKGQTYGKQTK